MEGIKEYREKHLLTQEEFAHVAGVSVSTISRLENGKKSIGDVKVKTAAAIARAMGISINDLLVFVFEHEDKIIFGADFEYFSYAKATLKQKHKSTQKGDIAGE